MIITEQDLFNLVFWRSKIPSEKTNYIFANYFKFRESVEFLQKILQHISDEIKPENWEELKQKIKSKNLTREFILRKEVGNNRKKFDKLVLAAASIGAETNFQPETFKDKDSQFLVKVFSNAVENKIYFFANDNKNLNKLEMKLKPSGHSYKLNGSKIPLIISPREKIDEIIITTIV